MGAFSTNNRTRRQAPRVPFAAAAHAVLPAWELSLAFVGPAEALRLNRALRKKTYVPNVLSYAVGPEHGEIVICLAEAAKQAADYGMSRDTFVLYLFIHGCLHLKGYPHSGTMEKRERTLLAALAKGGARVPPTHAPTHRNRHRHRHEPGQTGRRRRNR